MVEERFEIKWHLGMSNRWQHNSNVRFHTNYSIMFFTTSTFPTIVTMVQCKLCSIYLLQFKMIYKVDTKQNSLSIMGAFYVTNNSMLSTKCSISIMDLACIDNAHLITTLEANMPSLDNPLIKTVIMDSNL